MKEGTIEKSAATPAPEALEAIGQYSRRPLTPEEVYTFSLILCDNEVDRDGERFAIPALEQLAGLFVGKTGIFDHDPKGSNQTARIYSCRVDRDPARMTTAGEGYCALRAEAYMVRSPKNADLILEIDAGIKKEVSIGCAMGRSVCSVCGEEKGGCSHRPGYRYRIGGEERRCHYILHDPSDAYEWSFVAVPAQPAAGVTKGLRVPAELENPSSRHLSGEEHGLSPEVSGNPEALLKVWLGQTAVLTPGQRQGALDYLARLEEDAAQGQAWRAQLTKEAVRLGTLAEPELPRTLLAQTLEGLAPGQLEAWVAHFRRKAASRLPLVQTACLDAPGEGDETSLFKL